ncbi:MAG: SDR family NAD(P)-dependent oxidoreductase [Bacteroidota bacterium]
MKTILITGSTDGIGKLTAMKLAKAGHHVIIHGRNKKKLQTTIKELVGVSDQSRVSGYVADLSDLKSVENFGIQIATNYTKLDILINNAGVFRSPVSKNNQGLDIRLAVNYLAPFILTNDLLPLIKKSEEPRIINLSSAAQASVSLKALAGTEKIGIQEAYAQSKLAITMWSFWLANQEPNLNVIAVNPGSLLNTKMAMEAYGQFWAPVDKGANILVKLTTEPKKENHSGQYFDNDKGDFNQAHLDAYNNILISSLISETEKIIKDKNDK